MGVMTGEKFTIILDNSIVFIEKGDDDGYH